MIIGQFADGLGIAPRRIRSRRRRILNCVRNAVASGQSVLAARLACARRFPVTAPIPPIMRRRLRRRRAHRLHESELGAYDPSFLMIAGMVHPWTPRDPRQPLSQVAQTAYTATHPVLAGNAADDVLMWERIASLDALGRKRQPTSAAQPKKRKGFLSFLF